MTMYKGTKEKIDNWLSWISMVGLSCCLFSLCLFILALSYSVLTGFR